MRLKKLFHRTVRSIEANGFTQTFGILLEGFKLGDEQNLLINSKVMAKKVLVFPEIQISLPSYISQYCCWCYVRFLIFMSPIQKKKFFKIGEICL